MTRIVLIKDKKPLILRKEDVPDDGVWVCRCGLSADWPLCDSSHAEARKETEDKVYRYHRTEAGGPLHVETTTEDTEMVDPRPSVPAGGLA